MSEQTTKRWKLILSEAVAIVLSILLAFSIDAWWQERQQFQQDQIHLRAVLAELTQTIELISEAIDSHRETSEVGAKLLSIISKKAAVGNREQTAFLLRQLMSFYQINAPVGALNTATNAGVLARIRDRDLASALANWPVALDDLLEEQDSGHYQLLNVFLPMMSRKMPMAEVYGERINATTIRGTSEIAPIQAIAILPSPFSNDFSALNEDFEIENQIMIQTIMARVAEGEAAKFAGDLRSLTSRLETCLVAERC